MKKFQTLFSIIVIGLLSAGIAAVAFTGPGSNTPPAGTPAFWQVSGSNVYYSGGNIGIGTAGPGYKLQIYNSGSSDYGALSLKAGTTGGVVREYFNDNSGSKLYEVDADFTNNKLLLQSDTNTIMTITQSGNIGIGVAPAGPKLEVAGMIQSDGSSVRPLLSTDALPGNSTPTTYPVGFSEMPITACVGHSWNTGAMTCDWNGALVFTYLDKDGYGNNTANPVGYQVLVPYYNAGSNVMWRRVCTGNNSWAGWVAW